MQTSLPKFYVGQKVVVSQSSPFAKKGRTGVVESVKVGCCKKTPFIYQIGVIDDRGAMTMCCFKYVNEFGTPSSIWFEEFCLAPIHEEFQAITFEKVIEKELASVN